jgi:hypothetical protein
MRPNPQGFIISTFLVRGDRGALPLADGVVGPELGESRTPMKGGSLAFFNRYLR